MTGQRKVIIVIEADGTTVIDAQGFQGQSCSLATRELELALAGNAGPDSDNKKPEFWQANPQANTQHV